MVNIKAKLHLYLSSQSVSEVNTKLFFQRYFENNGWDSYADLGRKQDPKITGEWARRNCQPILNLIANTPPDLIDWFLTALPATSIVLIKTIQPAPPIDDPHTQYALLHILVDCGLVPQYHFFDADFVRVTRFNYSKRKPLYFGHQKFVGGIKEKVNNIRKLSRANRIGIIPEEDSEIVSLLAADPRAWVSNDSRYYTYSHPRNTMFNLLGKVKTSIKSSVPIHLLAQRLHQSLHRRCPNPPSAEIIKQFLQDTTDKKIKTTLPQITPLPLTSCEFDLITLLNKNRGELPYTAIIPQLKAMSHTIPTISQTLSFSPLIYIDRSHGRGKHTYKTWG